MNTSRQTMSGRGTIAPFQQHASRAARSGRTPTALRGALAVAAAAWLVGSPTASAQTSYLRGIAWTTNTPAIQQSYTNVPMALLSGVIAHDEIGNDGKANGSMAAPAGMFTVSSHACSGGGPGFGGNANGTATAFVTLDYVITSATLPAGTPVSVSVRWAVHSNVKAVGQDLVGANSSANGGAYGQVSILVNGTAVDNQSGQLTRRHNTFDGISGGNLGSLYMADDSADLTLTVPLGLLVRVYMYAEGGSASASEGGSTIDADVQMAMVWGVTALTNGCVAVLASDPSEPAPPASAATPAHALEIVPPRPAVGALPCFRVSTQPGAASACTADAATFSVVVLGTGPFSYQWRKGGVPIGIVGNPSAATATLSLTNISAADAASYDCIMTNPCGSITSDAATLAVNSAPVISQEPSPASACPTGSGAFMVTGAGPGPFTYQWQVQTGPATWLAPGDDPGSPLPCGGFAYATPPNSRAVTIGIRPCPGSPGASQHFQIRCVVSNACGSVTSNEATYTICPADFNCSGSVTVSDIFDFLAAWFAGATTADFNGVNGANIQDIFDFLAAWFLGC